MTGGALNLTTASDAVYIGESGNGAMVMTGTSSFTTATNEIDIGLNGGSGGTLTLMKSATLNQSLSSTLGLYVGRGANTTAELNIQNSAVIDADRITVGLQAPGVVNQTGGTVNLSVGASGNLWRIGANSGSGVWNISGGELNSIGLDMKLAYNTSSGTLNVSGTGFVNMPNNAILMDFNGAARATVELSGGTLLTTSVQQITASGTGTFDFNGGVLEPAAPTTTFLQGLTAANVQVGGAVINTLGNNITIAQNLVHDPSLGTATDGGLTKLGNGMLTLSATVNTFNGPTTVNGGTLQLSGGAGTDLEDSTLNTNGTGTVHFTGVKRRNTGRYLRQWRHKTGGRQSARPDRRRQQQQHDLLRFAGPDRRGQLDEERRRHAHPQRHGYLFRRHVCHRRHADRGLRIRPAEGPHADRRGRRHADLRPHAGQRIAGLL